MFQSLRETKIEDWPTLLSGNIMSSQYAYLKLIIQLTFITNGLTLIDAPHRIFRFLGQLIHKFKQRHNIFKKPYVDDYEF